MVNYESERWGKLQSSELSEGPSWAPPFGTTRAILEAVRQAAQMVIDGTALEGEWPRRAVALRDLCRAVFETDGRMQGLPPEEFRERQGDLLFRGVSNFKYVRDNLNGEWAGTGVISDGNYYGGTKSRLDAIQDYGFDDPFGWGWAMPYKLNPEASLIEATEIGSISLIRFINAVLQRLDIEEHWLKVLYEMSNDNAFRAVLLGYDGMIDSGIDHYAIYNNRMLVYKSDCTPWAHGINQALHKLGEIETSTEIPRPQLADQGQAESSNALIVHDLSNFQNNGVDNKSALRLKYVTVANEVRQELMEMGS